jgi:hypothetical protein
VKEGAVAGAGCVVVVVVVVVVGGWVGGWVGGAHMATPDMKGSPPT